MQDKADPKEFISIANLLLALNDSDLLKTEEFWTHLKAFSENHHNEEDQKKTRSIVEDFIKFYKTYSKNSIPQSLELVKGKSIQPVRMYVDGCFDMVHSGHFNAIRQAKALTDILVVCVICNEEIEHHKGPPVMDLAERAEIISACRWVDEVATDNIPYNPSIELIDRLNCQYVAHGDDMALSADGTDSYYEIKKAGRMRTFKRTDGISTTDIVGRLLLFTKQTQNQDNSKALRKLSGENLLTSSNLAQVVEETKEEENQPQPNKEKIQLLQTTRRIRQFSSGKEPKPTDKIVYLDGSFDILHVGHVRILKKAKEQGDFLIVGIHDDETVNKHKGSNYPIMSIQERVLNVLAMKYVDEVIIGAPWKLTDHLIKSLNIQVVVQGALTKHMEHENLPHHLEDDPYELAKKLGIYKQVDSGCDMTTEGIIVRIIENRKKLMKAHEIKKQKLENYYKNKDFSIQEN